ncbi:hypothetical protein RYZ26_14595 [Terasakiella sp. A23]|uniref:hypothetical protein n=1 Tax=Terasakiella sp. FCG-A23 TaxID=3080561 RepID=UPI002954B0E3|nr:hypothetical protein [Terasakiella sp. A23]MDV7340832.1 hypothetical protein [Terasakiella sp. A23]
MSLTGTHQKVLWAFFAAVVGLKAVFLAIYGPMHLPDSGGYTRFADWILNDTQWRTSLDLKDYWYPPSGFRSIGYPAFIALMKLIASNSYDWLVVFVQMGLSLFVTYRLITLALALKLSFYVALFVGATHAISLGFLLDQCVLTDSLNANILLCATLIMAQGIVEKRPVNWQAMITVGLLVALAFLIREAGSYLQYLYWPLAFWWLFRTVERWKQRALLFACLILPMIIFTQSYKTWNQMRTGERFVTTAGQTTVFFPVLELKKRGINAFENDPYLKDMPPYHEPLWRVAPLQNIRVINTHLVKEHGWDALDVSRYAFKTFFRLWMERPADMAKITMGAISLNQAFMPLSPVETALTYPFWETERKPFWDKMELTYKVRDFGRYDLLAAYVARHAERVVSFFITICFVLAVPVLIIRQGIKSGFRFTEMDQNLVLFGLFWLIYIGFTGAYALVNLEQRYLLSVFPLCTLSGVYLWTRFFSCEASLLEQGESQQS